MFESDLVAFIIADAGVSDVIGSKLSPDLLSEGEEGPAATYSLITARRGVTMNGADGLTQYRVQIDIWGKQKSDVVSGRDALRTLLHGYAGTMGSTVVHLAQMIDESSHFEAEPRLFRELTEFYVWIQE